MVRDELFGGVREFLAAVRAERQLHDILSRVRRLFCGDSGLRIHHIRTGDDRRALGIRGIRTENQRAGLAQLLQDLVGVRRTGDLYRDAVTSLGIYIGLGGLILSALRQLVSRVLEFL